jgi:hypothetical protein
MTAKVSEAARRAFLAAYVQSGNVTLSAEQAGVSRSWVSRARRGDPAFDGLCRAAKAASAERLGGDESNRPPGAWTRSGGVELVVQRAGKRPRQLIRSLRARWTPRAEERFLGELRRCNNARLACYRAGMTVSSFEAHWRRWPGFRRRVAEARAFASLRIASRIEAGSNGPMEIPHLPEKEEAVSIADRIHLARRHKGRS